MPHKKTIASETDARKMKSFAMLGGLKEAPASIGGEYFTVCIGKAAEGTVCSTKGFLNADGYSGLPYTTINDDTEGKNVAEMLKFEKINGDDAIFRNQEYISDSLIFNAIESARNDDSYNIYTDHKHVIISTPKNGARVWIWTAAAIKSDTSKLVDVCRFLRDCNIPKVEIYVKPEVSGNLSDLYAITSLELDYVVKDELSLAVFTYKGDKKLDVDESSIICINKNDPEHVRLVREFYEKCCDEFRWHDKLDRKIKEYLDTELYAYVKDGVMLANAVIGNHTDEYTRIKSVAVLKDERRKGIGYKMCGFIVNKILDTKKTPILYAHVGNAAAVALWNKAGFKMRDKLCLLKIADNN